MTKKISCFMCVGTERDTTLTANEFLSSEVVREVIILSPDSKTSDIKGCRYLKASSLHTTQTLRLIVENAQTEYILLYAKTETLQLGAYALERLLSVAEATGAGMVYSDSYQLKEGILQAHPTIDCQAGSLRDDFDFGSLLLYRTSCLKTAVAQMSIEYQFAALYDLRLKVSETNFFIRLPEYLYTEKELDTRLSGEKIFDYVDPKNRNVQIEMEQACTEHLKRVGAFLAPSFKSINFNATDFPVEASVIIPVRNREKTIEDAVRSVLCQKTDFPFNIIVVDNHSTDATSDILRKIASEDKRLIHNVPERNDLGIGGCWNSGIMDKRCGKFAIQLDSDDLYIDGQVISKIVNAFYEQHCAMVVGSYKMVNFQLEEIPPGLIDHKEWTPGNGRNNALRINGLGAPRAFYTPVLREIKIPNTSYGEDYAAGLAISRYYQIGRIYEPLYLCRRWDDNSDASLDIAKVNAHNLYKDRIRTIELIARQKINEQAD